MNGIFKLALRFAACAAAWRAVEMMGVWSRLDTFDGWFLLGAFGYIAMMFADMVAKGAIATYEEQKS